MDYRELLEKYKLILSENSRLIKENERLNLSYGSAQESIMRIESHNISNELIKSLESQ